MTRCIWQFSWNLARNSRVINSTTGVVLAPEVQPRPHQVIGAIDLILQLGTLEQWG